MPSPPLTRAQSRDLDRRAITDYGIPGVVLMENAGRGCVDVLERLGINGPVVILCGKGNNAGDGFVIARHLDLRGHQCHVVLLGPSNELRSDAAINFAIAKKLGIPIIDAAVQQTAAALRQMLDEHTRDAEWLVDALLGTGAVGDPRYPFDVAIECMNARSKNVQLLAVDVPSGFDCDTGQSSKPTVRADHTCTFGAMKIGYTNPAAAPFTGTVHICDIGVPPRILGSK